MAGESGRGKERKYLKKVGPENEETSSSCNELEIFPPPPPPRLGVCEPLIERTFFDKRQEMRRKEEEEEKLNDKKNEEDEVEEYGITF